MKTSLIVTLCFTTTLALPQLSGKIPFGTEVLPGRIINGEIASKGQFPWQAAVIASTNFGNSFCGGSLISDRWVLTAAHCAENSRSFTIYLGTNSLTPDSGTITFTSNRAIIHAGWNPVTVENDIAVIELPRPVDFTDFIRPIDLATNLLTPGTPVTVSGWGKIRDSATGVTPNLNYVELGVIDSFDCALYYGDVHPGIVCASHLTSSVQSTCSGDSGGPLITGTGDTAVQVGIVSFVSVRGCESGYPSGYTRVAYYRDWIREKTGV